MGKIVERTHCEVEKNCLAALGLICHMQESLEWWKTAFGTEYFHIFEMLFPEPTETEAIFFARFLPKGGSVLDLGCGTGRHSLALSKAGFLVTGIDSSGEALELANKRAKELGNTSTFLQGDIRSINLGQSFDLVLLVGNVFGYGTDEDQKKILLRANSHLKNNGVFILAVHNSLRSLGSLKDHGSHEQTIRVRGKNYHVKEDYHFDPRHLIKTSTWSVMENKNECYKQDTRVRFYVAPEIQNMADASGLNVNQLFGSYKGEPFSASSQYLILQCDKK